MSSLAQGAPGRAWSVPRLGASAVRWALASSLLGGAAYLASQALPYRMAEARGASWVLRTFFALESRTSPDRPVFFYQRVAGDDFSWRGLVVTAECTSLFFVLPILVLGAVVLASRRASTWRVLAAVAAATGFLVAVNLGRCAAIALASIRWGDEGFRWAHHTAGSVVMLVALTGCLVLFFRLGFFGRRGGQARQTSRTRRERAEGRPGGES
ncbi:archaeosortase/exosortase family protein [Oerskovia enterophila]